MKYKEGFFKEDDDEEVNRIRKNCMYLFRDSVGYEFRVKGTILLDYVKGVDWQFNHVCGETFGNFHVDYCELTGRKKLEGGIG